MGVFRGGLLSKGSHGYFSARGVPLGTEAPTAKKPALSVGYKMRPRHFSQAFFGNGNFFPPGEHRFRRTGELQEILLKIQTVSHPCPGSTCASHHAGRAPPRLRSPRRPGSGLWGSNASHRVRPDPLPTGHRGPNDRKGPEGGPGPPDAVFSRGWNCRFPFSWGSAISEPLDRFSVG